MCCKRRQAIRTRRRKGYRSGGTRGGCIKRANQQFDK